jgi:hypothetical protein
VPGGKRVLRRWGANGEIDGRKLRGLSQLGWWAGGPVDLVAPLAGEQVSGPIANCAPARQAGGLVAWWAGGGRLSVPSGQMRKRAKKKDLRVYPFALGVL